jgi:glucose/arabinose dehydrogenase
VIHVRRRLAIGAASAALLVAGIAGGVTAGSGGVRVSQILDGYNRPVLVTNDGFSDRLYIVEQVGMIRKARHNRGSWARTGTFLDIRSLVSDPQIRGNGERGLLGLAFDPGYPRNGLLYVYYTRRSDGALVIAEYRRRGAAKADPGSRRTVLVIPHPQFGNHNGGNLAFGPDGYLYAATGDGGGGGDPNDNAQDRSVLLGKMLRINPHNPPGSARYSVPPGNPFTGPGERRAIWSLGLRNPWRWSFDRLTGDLWIGDVGQGVGGPTGYEEINRSRARGGRNAGRAVNYGWDVCEGRHRYTGTYNPEPPGCTVHTRPVLEHPHASAGDDNCAIVGGFVHRGPDAPTWRGTYVYGDTCSGRVWAVNRSPVRRLDVLDTSLTISSFGEDIRGRIFLTSLSGTVHRVRFRGSPPSSSAPRLTR